MGIGARRPFSIKSAPCGVKLLAIICDHPAVAGSNGGAAR
jgi:hypothetical protein